MSRAQTTGMDLAPDGVPATPGEPYRLHTTVSRIQIPTLVLGHAKTPVTDLTPAMFSISLDSGPGFQPIRARLEGDDPISLAVFIDASGSQKKLTAGIADALASLVPDALHPTDHISIFIADCRMIRTRLNTPAEGQDIRRGVMQALADVHPATAGKPVSCAGSFHLWDFAGFMFDAMQSFTGHRVALLISGGHDVQSRYGIREIADVAARNAVSVFGVRDRSEGTNYTYKQRHLGQAVAAFKDAEDPFEILCAMNGGTVLDIDSAHLGVELQRFMQLVRGRYLLEFPQPHTDRPGLHGIIVTLPAKKRLLLRYAGVSYTHAKVDDDPTAIPSEESPAVYGPRHPINPKY